MEVGCAAGIEGAGMTVEAMEGALVADKIEGGAFSKGALGGATSGGVTEGRLGP